VGSQLDFESLGWWKAVSDFESDAFKLRVTTIVFPSPISRLAQPRIKLGSVRQSHTGLMRNEATFCLQVILRLARAASEQRCAFTVCCSTAFTATSRAFKHMNASFIIIKIDGETFCLPMLATTILKKDKLLNHGSSSNKSNFPQDKAYTE
jgi:hypothetical protein